MGSSRFGLKVGDEENKCIPHEFSQIPSVNGDRSVSAITLPVGDNAYLSHEKIT